MVSAGESVEVTLPRNEVKLNAFVIPTPPEGKETRPAGDDDDLSHLLMTLPVFVTIAASLQGPTMRTTGI